MLAATTLSRRLHKTMKGPNGTTAAEPNQCGGGGGGGDGNVFVQVHPQDLPPLTLLEDGVKPPLTHTGHRDAATTIPRSSCEASN